MPLEDIAGYLDAIGLSILPIETRHVTVTADPAPDTRDPFDRMLLAQCQVEGLRLVTMDRALANHPLALKT
jgi:PIN domain nuclease of toxin-antitoxin system